MIKDQETQDYLTNLKGEDRNAWIGAYRSGEEASDFQWVQDGSTIDFTAWQSTEPK